MHDSTPAPFGDVTRRWTNLDAHDREWHAVRLLGRCAGRGYEAVVGDEALVELSAWVAHRRRRVVCQVGGESTAAVAS